MATINQINRRLESINNTIVDAYNAALSQPIPAAYIRQNLTYVGLKQGYRFGDSILTLTQDVNPDFEDPIDRADKTKIKNPSKAALIFGTSQALHDRPVKNKMPNGATQSRSNYDYGGIQIEGIKSHTFELNGSSSGYNPGFDTEEISEPLSTHLSYFCGFEMEGDYPYRYITSGAPVSIYNLASAIEGREGPFNRFKFAAREKLVAQGYDPVGGVQFNTKELFGESVSVVYGALS